MKKGKNKKLMIWGQIKMVMGFSSVNCILTLQSWVCVSSKKKKKKTFRGQFAKMTD